MGWLQQQGAVAASPLPLPGYWIWQNLTKFNLRSWQFHKGNHLRRGSISSVQSQSISMLSSAETPPVVGSTQQKTELLCDGREAPPYSHWRGLPSLRTLPLDRTRWADRARSGVSQPCSSIACTQGKSHCILLSGVSRGDRKEELELTQCSKTLQTPKPGSLQRILSVFKSCCSLN